MTPAKLLGLPATKDSIIVRAPGRGAFRMLPRPSMARTVAGADDGEGSKVLRSLIALRRRRGQQ